MVYTADKQASNGAGAYGLLLYPSCKDCVLTVGGPRGQIQCAVLFFVSNRNVEGALAAYTRTTTIDRVTNILSHSATY